MVIGLRRAALVAAATLSALASAGSALATSPGGNGLLAFAGATTVSGTSVHLFTMHPDGTSVADLTPGLPAGHRVYVLSWSPDGGTLAYAVGETGDTYSLNLIDADGSNPRRLLTFQSSAATISWTPDGTSLTYLVTRPSYSQIVSVKTDGSDPHTLVQLDGAQVVEATLSPDGTRFALAANFHNLATPMEIWLVNADGSGLRLLRRFDTDALSWSPDGTQVTAADAFDGIWTFGLDGSRRRLLEDDSAFVPTWAPDGTRLAFVSGRWEEYEFAPMGVMNADGSCPTVLLPRDVRFLAWQPIPGGPAATERLRCSDLVVQESLHLRYVQRGRMVPLRVVVRNRAGDPSRPISLEIHTTRALDALRATPTQGTCTLGHPVRCSLGSLDPGRRVTVDVAARAMRASREIDPYAFVPAHDDPDLLNNYGSLDAFVICDRLGGSGADVLVGSARRDLLCGLGGGDVLRGRGGNDFLLGGTGGDRMFGGPGADVLLGEDGRDVLSAAGGPDVLDGGRGYDTMLAGSGNDEITARDGWPDFVDGGPGHDVVRDHDASDRLVAVEVAFPRPRMR